MSEVSDNIRRSSVVESDTPPESATGHRTADQRALGQGAQQHFADAPPAAVLTHSGVTR
ncbi:MAG: hypothetical protein ACRDS9_13070 [Pseudonocardiaceae bacterium]